MSRATRLLLSVLAVPTFAVAQGGFQLSRNTTIPLWSAYDGIYDLTAGDVDGDGDIDLVYGCDHDPNRLYLNDGRGSFTDATAGRLITPTTPQPTGWSNATYEVDLVDLDGDGDLDLLMVNDHFLYSRVYQNNGAGYFTDVTTTAVPADTDYSIDQVVADFDGDGDPDWIVVNVNGPIRYYENGGTGTFTDVSATRLPGLGVNVTTYHNSFAADLDADGDLDLVWNNPYGSPRLLQNQGGILQTWTGTLPAGATGTLVAADVDGDGLVDLFAQGGRKLLRNTGGMTFSDVSATNLPVGWLGTVVAIADVDLDGDLDAIGPGNLLRNDGTGVFTSTSGLAPTTLVSACVVADVDDDGDPDLVDVMSQTRLSPWINNLCQVRTPAAPMRGQPYTIEFRAPVRSAPVVFGPAVANAATLLPLPPFGTLRIDLLQGTFLWPLVDTTGHSTITWTIPNQPALLGTELHYQAVVFDPLRAPFLTNTIRDVIQ